MMNLEQEAKEYAKSLTKNETYMTYLVNAVMFGANSKSVQIEKIKTQIEVLENVDGEHYRVRPIWEVIKELEQELKELENG